MHLRIIYVVDESGTWWAFAYYVMPELEPGITFEFGPSSEVEWEELPA